MKTILPRISIALLATILLTGALFIGFAMAEPSTPSAAGDPQESVVASAGDEDSSAVSDGSTGSKAIAAAIAIGLASLGGAIAMGVAIAKSSEGISRQPEAAEKIRTSLMLGLVFIETAIIYALIVAILIVFVL